MKIRFAGGVVCLLAASCEAGGVGDPCVTDDEYSPGFSGYALTEANVESRSFSCSTRVCIVNHFQGRVTCPFGQTANAADGCKVPGSGEAVTAAVAPWDLDRPPERAVYCSCRCGGPDRDVDYCECPSGFSCEEIVPKFGLGKRQLEGSYCVKNGTAFDPREVGGATCQSTPEAAECSHLAD